MPTWQKDCVAVRLCRSRRAQCKKACISKKQIGSSTSTDNEHTPRCGAAITQAHTPCWPVQALQALQLYHTHACCVATEAHQPASQAHGLNGLGIRFLPLVHVPDRLQQLRTRPCAFPPIALSPARTAWPDKMLVGLWPLTKPIV